MDDALPRPDSGQDLAQGLQPLNVVAYGALADVETFGEFAAGRSRRTCSSASKRRSLAEVSIIEPFSAL
ncbi:hypothetical protein FHX37_2140 [Haloactinospora alba]|uniref:Uncharacterized protein n=1 Tax=Haloactinospora alba TaxID=405555 RepID=A0A543NK76_9ACTN|nr:hypothetical protein [Haloactinospora alba]TQN32194.1 hypothetical protein FHX37_2140 [Haloactinospora alba]